ncbi:MAG: DUF748 domain-containing protein, partial [Methylococcus sp.]
MSLPKLLLDSLADRLRLLLLLAVMLGLYAAAGYLGAPYLARTWLLPQIARSTGLSVEADALAFDPFRMGVRLEGVRVRDSLGKAAFSMKSARVSISPIDSLRRWRPTVSLELEAPAVWLNRDRQGRWTLAGLGGGDARESRGLPAAFHRLLIHDGSLEISDDLRGKRVTSRLTDIDLDLRDLHGESGELAGLNLAAKGGNGESLALEAHFALDPLKVEGRLESTRLDLPFWADLAKPDLDWRIATGQLDTRLQFRYPAATPVGIAVTADRIALTGLNMLHRQDRGLWFRAGGITLVNSRLEEGSPRLSIGSLDGQAVESSWGKLGRFKADGLITDLSSRDTQLSGVSLQQLDSKQGRAADLTAGNVSYAAATGLIGIGNLKASAIDTAQGSARGLAAEGLLLRYADDPTLRDARWTALTADGLETKQGRAQAVVAGTMTYDARTRQLQIDRLAVGEANSEQGNARDLRWEQLTVGMGEDGAPRDAGWQALTLGSADLRQGKARELSTGPSQIDLAARQIQLSQLRATELEPAGRGAVRQLRLDGVQVQLRPGADLPDVSLNGVELGQVDLPLDKVKSEGLRTGRFEYDAGHRLLHLSALQATVLASEWGNLQGLDAADLAYGLADRHVEIGRMTLGQADSRWGRVDTAEIGGLVYRPGENHIRLDRFAAREIDSEWGRFSAPALEQAEAWLDDRRLTLASLTLGAAETRWGKLGGLEVTQLAADAKGPALRVGSLVAANLEAPQGAIGNLAATELRYDGPNRHLTLASGAVGAIHSAVVDAGRIELEALDYHHAGKRFQVKSAHLTDAVAQGFIPDEAVPIPSPTPAAANPANGASQPATGSQQDAGQTYPRRARLGSLTLEDVQGGLEPAMLTARRISSAKTEMDVIRRKNRALEIRGLAAFAPAKPGTGNEADPVQYAIDELQLDDYSVNFYDETAEPPVRLRFNGLTLKSFDVSSNRDDAMEFRVRSQIGSSARFEAEGRLQLNPLRTSFRFGLDKLRMRSIEPYWKPLTNLDLKSGNISLWGDVIARQTPELNIDYAGGAEVLEFDSVDRVHHEPVLKWGLIRVDGLAMSTHPKRFVARSINAERPFARVALDEKRRLNLLDALEPPSQAAIPKELEALQVERTPVKTLPSASVGLLRIKDGIVDFSDRSMKPGFSGTVTQFDGTITGLSSRTDAMATLSLNGRFNGNAPVHVFGELDPIDYRDHTNITAQFKGINLTTFSSYSGKFGGYRIEKGKLDLNLNYTMRNGLMEVTSQAVLDKLTLGDRVDDNTPWLVNLAIAILKNSDGKIDIDLPVYGDITNPQFNLWTLYRDAFASLLAKLLYTPASLVSEMVNSGAARHYTLSFPAGESTMIDNSTEALKTVASLMRAELGATLDIRGTADPVRDRKALAAQALLEQLKNDRRVELRAQGIRLRGAPVPDLTEEDYQRLFTAYYRTKFPGASELRALEQDRLKTLGGKLFDTARAKVLTQWPIDETRLRAL